MPKNPPRGLTATGDNQPVKASIWNEDQKPAAEVVKFLFNPNTFSIRKTSNWGASSSQAEDVPRAMFAGGGPETLTIDELLFDTYTMEPQAGKENLFPPSVRTYTDQLVNLAKIDPSLRDPKTQRARPPRVTLRWGSWTSFISVVTSVTQRFTLFTSSGTPVRAIVSLTLQEVADVGEFPGTNPTSRAEVQRVHRVSPGEMIDSVAFKFYGDASRWKTIADYNNLANPMRLTPGQLLSIPDLK
jgi:nucleoid-associated protein YgaU